jgi:hypothetical protein
MAITSKERPGLKSKISAKTAQLVNDLNAVRMAISKQRNPAEYAGLEPRLFESWVIEKMAESECLLLSVNEQLIELREEVREEMLALRKALPKPEKKAKK